MKVTLSLQQNLLRQRLSKVRRALKGTPVPVVLVQSTGKGLASSFPIASKHSQNPLLAKSAIKKQEKVDIYSNKQKDVEKTTKSKTTTSPAKKGWLNALFIFFITLSTSLLLILFAPVVYYTFFSADPVPVEAAQEGTPLGGNFSEGVKETQPEIQEPPYDETLPEGNWLIIPRIGVRTEILESEKSEESLMKGVWRVPDFGTPGERTEPMILAAHRYGYNWWWRGQYWRYHSFYLLPDLEPGDFIEVISHKRKYKYEIYAGEEGEEITDYNADLILYTCKFLNSPIRHFRYARLINPEKNTQNP